MPVVGGLVFVVAMVVAVPVGVMLAGAVWSAVFGWAFTEQPSDPKGEGNPA
jgi:FlaG/FlaF family flagellin (archaellin)